MTDFELRTLKVGFLATNCYILRKRDNGATVVIDPGADGTYIKSVLREMDARLKLILLTHGHFDHILGLAELRREGVVTAIHEKDAKNLTERDMFSSMLENDPRPFAPAEILFTEDKNYSISGFDFYVMNTPGHTPGSVCYVFDDLMFTGDTLFCGGIGRTDFSGGSDADMDKSLERLVKLPGDFAIYPGHDESGVLSDEKKYNPYLAKYKKT